MDLKIALQEYFPPFRVDPMSRPIAPGSNFVQLDSGDRASVPEMDHFRRMCRKLSLISASVVWNHFRTMG